VQVNNLREINTLKRLAPHPNIITLLEILYDKPSGRLALVMEIMSMNLYDLIKCVGFRGVRVGGEGVGKWSRFSARADTASATST
jgi:serine/threonine protein kinase